MKFIKNTLKLLKQNKVLKRILVPVIFFGGIHKLISSIRSIIKGTNFRILVYHSFTRHQNDIKFRLDEAIFEKHIKYLKENYHICSLENIIKSIRDGKKIQNNCICITIDDGYLDNYEIAYPILKKYNVPATIFITSRYILDGKKPYSEQMQRSPTNEYAWYQANKDNQNIFRMPRLPMMSWGHINEMRYNLIEIGSHTLYHPILTKVPINVAKQEIVLSKEEIEARIFNEVSLL